MLFSRPLPGAETPIAGTQPSTTPSTRPPTDQSTTGTSQTGVAEQELIRKLEEAGYMQVRDIKSTAEGIAVKATALWIGGIASNVNYCRRKFRSKSRVKIERRN
jgi:hypothetical protein